LQSCIVFASTVTSFVFLKLCQKAISILERQSLLHLNWPEHLDSICMSQPTAKNAEKRIWLEQRWDGFRHDIKICGCLREKRRSNSVQQVMLQSGRYRKKALRNELRSNSVSGL